MTFRWEMVATGGEVTQGGLGFSNPDNLALDALGNLWMVRILPPANSISPLPQAV
ncbi:hypothetical protein PL11201_40020 [Planktothrix sp. PCC 11201]|uniref:DUF839 domain-containing protein n=1 Tax=Planktothrix sp. PCC 11201 TaxID=1729650 RepID=UPI000923290A|nr:DUF839 domain-containing protein [Planktothrix sp. PCC 11201]SKB12553.1 hypothetical protein PL11201_40020 [Planktothrix sp. PCC 11201]